MDSEPKNNPSCLSCISNILTFGRKIDSDKRLASAYLSYHVGRFSSLVGSAMLLFGLLIKFVYLGDKRPLISIMVTIIVFGSVAAILFGSIAIFWSAGKGRKAQLRYEEERKLRPGSAMSDYSFAANPNDQSTRSASSPNQSFMYVSPPLTALYGSTTEPRIN
ncbi:hypothetical protein HDE_11582 [Halotydeus destructor]|nr:hypothetical protein HDE_11582 [Halotydeus destructor]